MKKRMLRAIGEFVLPITMLISLLTMHFALGIYTLDKIGSSLAGYALGIMFPLFISDDFLYAVYGRKTTRNETDVIEIDADRKAEFDTTRKIVRLFFLIQILLWLLAVASGVRARAETVQFVLSLIFGTVSCSTAVGIYLW